MRLVTQSLPAPRLCKRIDAGRPHAHVADEGGISRATLTKWYKGWLLHGSPPEQLSDEPRSKVAAVDPSVVASLPTLAANVIL